jgi:hypothetical protein
VAGKRNYCSAILKLENDNGRGSAEYLPASTDRDVQLRSPDIPVSVLPQNYSAVTPYYVYFPVLLSSPVLSFFC